MLNEFGAQLRRVREASGQTQVAVAAALKLKPATISLFESGGLCPTLTTLHDLARVLGVPAAELLRQEVTVSADPATAEEVRMMDTFRRLNIDDQRRIADLLGRLAAG